jgi:hypothetical protein
MPHWVNTLLPIVTLVAGALLTMAGQAFSDRRKQASERLAREQEFQNSNFEVHRTALLDMQEVLRDSFIAVGAERSRRILVGDYEFFNTRPLENFRGREELFDAGRIEALTSSAVDSSLSEDERKAFLTALQEKMEVIMGAVTNAESIFQATTERFEGHFEFMDSLVQFIYHLRLGMYRSGSNSVVYCGERYIRAMAKWNDNLVTDNENELYEEVRTSQYGLNRAISNALKSGPYDKYEPWNEMDATNHSRDPGEPS